MSSQNGFPGPNAARPAARPVNQEQLRQPTWVQAQAPAGQAPQQVGGWPQQQPPQGYQGGYAQPSYAPQQAPQQPAYGQWSELQPAYAGQAAAAAADPYAPQFEPYVAPARPAPAYGQPQGYPQQQQPMLGYSAAPAPQWAQRSPDPRGFDVGAYAPPGAAPQATPQAAHGAQAYAERPYHETDISSSDWAGPTGGFGHDPYQQAQGDAQHGFAQAEGGELDPAYNEDDGDYELEDAPRGRRPMMIAAALIGAILIGGGMAYGYKKFASSTDTSGDPPVVKSEDFPSKTKPADAGGKQFPYADSKIMGRLGDGTSSAPADDSAGGSSAPSTLVATTPSTDQASSSVDDSGTRKVSTLVVGRDGTIQAPPTAAATASAPAADTPSVPGTQLVDVFGANKGQDSDAPASAAPSKKSKIATAETDDAPAAPTKRTVKPVTIAKVDSTGAKTSTTTGSIDENDAAPPKHHKKSKKVARADTTTTDAAADAPAAATSGGSGGYVAVLASVPRSSSSRMDALKRFADMQQKYTTALAGKTPDVASANLGDKGSYDRLIVGPPGSRQEASNVCSQLKTQGYNDCWVTSY